MPRSADQNSRAERPLDITCDRRRFCALGLLALIACCGAPAAALGGCAPGAETGSSPSGASSAAQAASDALPSNAEGASQPDTIALTDSVGRTVAVPACCTRIAALDSFSGEALVMAGAGPLVVAVPRGVASDTILLQLYPDLATVPSPQSGGTVNVESLWALDPDVVLVKPSLYYSQEEIGKLDKLGMPYLVIDYLTIEEQLAALEMIGSILPSEQAQRMAAIVSTYRSGVERVEACAARIPDDERLRVYHAINQAVITDGPSSIGADWITRVGGIDVSAVSLGADGGTEASASSDRGDYQATLEQVFVWDPDIVICNEASTATYLLSDSKWAGLRSVADGRVYNIPVGATRWGQRGSVETWFAMMWLGTTAYPEYYGEIDLREEVAAFYGTVLGIDVDDALYEQMLSGQGMRKQATGKSVS